MKTDINKDIGIAVLGAGCFWCIEAVFQNLRGVKSVESGYTGGSIKNPSYREICTGRTGHAEVAKIEYDPAIVSFKEVLEVFWKTHDPTTLNQQGADRGTQYRSAIFYHDDYQKELAEFYKKELDLSKYFDNAIVTEITALGEYYKADENHQNYYKNNPDQPYCSFVIAPKVDKFKKIFQNKMI